MPTLTLMTGDVLDELAKLPAASVHCVVTSPPYWGLRDYGIEPSTWPDGWTGCFGLEPTPEQYVAHAVEVFRAVRRVLRDDGTLWLNLGDTYSRGSVGRGDDNRSQLDGYARSDSGQPCPDRSTPSLGNKQLVGIPWRVALALQADGWYLRSDVIWHKPAPMPTSQRDRPTVSHEYVFLLTKRARYYYDRIAGAEVVTENTHSRGSGVNPKSRSAAIAGHVSTRNARTVWRVSHEGFRGKHFATMPQELVRRCLVPCVSERGCCPECGAPWARITESVRVPTRPGRGSKIHTPSGRMDSDQAGNRDDRRHVTQFRTAGWRSACRCAAGRPGTTAVPCTVLDPFMGSGTVGLVAIKLGHHAVGIDRSPEYVAMARQRILAAAGVLVTP